MNTSASMQALSMVLICSAGKSSDQLISRWSHSGQELSAVVIAAHKPGRPLSAMMSRLQQSGTPVIQIQHPVDWSEIETALRAVKSDLLVCYGFMRMIPKSFLSMFTHGGVNFHPTLLPAYRGPHPTQCLVSDGTFKRFGGLTLHELSECFDQGDILAQSKFLPQDYHTVPTYRRVLISTMIAMVKEVLPAYCLGHLNTKRQTQDMSAWARYYPRCTIINQDWTTDDVAAACAFLRERDRLFVQLPNGKPISITGFQKRVSSEVGKPSTLNFSTLVFDCADGRVSVFRNNRLGRFVRRISIKLKHSEYNISRPLIFETKQSEN